MISQPLLLPRIDSDIVAEIDEFSAFVEPHICGLMGIDHNADPEVELMANDDSVVDLKAHLSG